VGSQWTTGFHGKSGREAGEARQAGTQACRTREEGGQGKAGRADIARQAGWEGKAKQEPGRQDKGIRQAMSGIQGRQTDESVRQAGMHASRQSVPARQAGRTCQACREAWYSRHGKEIESMMQLGRAGLAGTARQEGRRWEEKEVRQAARQGRMGIEVRQGRHAGRAG
jgi:hypothetical protein